MNWIVDIGWFKTLIICVACYGIVSQVIGFLKACVRRAKGNDESTDVMKSDIMKIAMQSFSSPSNGNGKENDLKKAE
jgi:hypothetical protein